MKKHKILIAIIFLVGLAIAGFLLFSKPEKNNSIKIIQEDREGNVQIKTEKNQEDKNTSEKVENKITKKIIPEKTLIPVPFISQAPKKIWDALHEDACEEASLLMVENFLQKETAGTIEAQDKEIKSIVQYETKNNYGLSVTLEELAKIAQDYSGMKKPRVEKEATIEKIKQELANGKPVIIPAAGKILPNPNFKNGGPNYHMLVVKGYDANGFITNDPGTRKGENFRYTFQALFNAIHDWNPKNIMLGQKAYLVFD